MELVGGRGHYERVLAAVLDAKVSVWIATANVKELMVEAGALASTLGETAFAANARGRKRSRDRYVSVLGRLDELAGDPHRSAASGQAGSQPVKIKRKRVRRRSL